MALLLSLGYLRLEVEVLKSSTWNIHHKWQLLLLPLSLVLAPDLLSNQPMQGIEQVVEGTVLGRSRGRGEGLGELFLFYQGGWI